MSIEAALGTTFGIAALLTVTTAIIVWRHSRPAAITFLTSGILPVLAIINNAQRGPVPHETELLAFHSSTFIFVAACLIVAAGAKVARKRAIALYILCPITFCFLVFNSWVVGALMNIAT